MYNFNLRNCINEPTRFGALLDPIIHSDECEISFSDVIQIDRNISDILYHIINFVPLGLILT
jgi:hypothetical protein